MAKRYKNATEILESRDGSNPRIHRLRMEARAAIEVAGLIYDARMEAGLSQTELARLIGTTQSAISRLEDADYTGHSLSMLHRVAAALSKKVDIRLVAQSSARRKPVVEKKRKAS